MNENKPSAILQSLITILYKDAGWYCTCEVISVHPMEQQETNKEDKTDASDYHSTQQETVAAFSLDNLGMRQQH